MARRILITGVSGFTGRHLAAHLRGMPDVYVLGTSRSDRGEAAVDAFRRCDLADPADVAELIAWARPDVVHHLAGLHGAATAAELQAVNVGGFETLRRALRGCARSTPVRMLVVGSAAEIGPVDGDQLPVDESVACRPATPYGASKHAVVRSALTEPADSGLGIVVARTFNLLGAGLDARLAPGAFAAQVRAIARGAPAEIRCGWLDGRRDYLDAADAARAYALLADHAPPGTLVNVCSGNPIRLGDLLTRMLQLAGVRATVVAGARGPHDVIDIHGSHTRLSALTGWQPAVPLDESLVSLLRP